MQLYICEDVKGIEVAENYAQWTATWIPIQAFVFIY
jgi:hypothetical protein